MARGLPPVSTWQELPLFTISKSETKNCWKCFCGMSTPSFVLGRSKTPICSFLPKSVGSVLDRASTSPSPR
jgi:hypothetical protein